MHKIEKQIRGLYLSTVVGNLSLTGAWVAILAARGYSLAQIGFAETVFHITSLLFELPSGVFADLFGRKRMLILSSLLHMVANMVMILSGNLFMVCLSLAFYATSYNFASGSGDALAYDSLKLVQRESYYEKYASNQLVIYRFCGGLSTLCAGFALFFMELGGILGAKTILKWKRWRYRKVFAVTAALVFCGIIAEHSGLYLLMVLGGFVAAFSDDALQVRTDTILQDMFPSEQRATLISIESFTFSVIMVVLSPLAGLFFTWW